jgi:hypothetical protein
MISNNFCLYRIIEISKIHFGESKYIHIIFINTAGFNLKTKKALHIVWYIYFFYYLFIFYIIFNKKKSFNSLRSNIIIIIIITTTINAYLGLLFIKKKISDQLHIPLLAKIKISTLVNNSVKMFN